MYGGGLFEEGCLEVVRVHFLSHSCLHRALGDSSPFGARGHPREIVEGIGSFKDTILFEVVVARPSFHQSTPTGMFGSSG